MDDPIHTEAAGTRSAYHRNLIGFWILGLTNNFAYVVMLSAAHDILENKPDQNNGTNWTTIEPVTESPGKLVPECNKIGTGAILLADILPTLVVKLTAPFYMHKIPYSVRVCTVVLFGAASFPIVSVSTALWLSILGVVSASIGAGFGEITFLSLSSHFNKNVISTWSSGTGAAGVFGALSYAGLTALGLSPRYTLLLMLVIPAAMAISYFLLLVKPVTVYEGFTESAPKYSVHNAYEHSQQSDDREGDSDWLVEHERRENEVEVSLESPDKFRCSGKIKLIVPLLKYMIPLALVYIGEYFINQALFELIYFENIWLPTEQQYRWYQVIYQVGVLLSRSSVNLFRIRYIWILPIFQFGNVAFFLCQVFFQFVPNIWIVFGMVLFEGLLGGWAYVNAFYNISEEVKEEDREFSMGVASVADSAGITVAGIVSVPIHNTICAM